eukprot:330420-Amphidinium_carterae.1
MSCNVVISNFWTAVCGLHIGTLSANLRGLPKNVGHECSHPLSEWPGNKLRHVAHQAAKLSNKESHKI